MANRSLARLRHAAIQRLLAGPGLNEARRLELQREIASNGADAGEEPRFEDLPK